MTTIHDVAKLAGVASGTASNVIAGKPGVSQAKQKAVREAARKLNYRPSSIARALSKRQSDMIGLLTHGLHGPSSAKAISVAESEIRRAGKHVVVASSLDKGRSDWHDDKALSFLDDRDCDGIIVVGGGWSERQLTQLARRAKPTAFVNRRLALRPEVSFSVDHFSAGVSIAHHLLLEGHNQFAALKGPECLQDASLRHNGFAQAVAAAGFPIHPELVEGAELDFSGGKAAAERLLATGRPFTAVLCGNDEQAVAVETALSDANHAAKIFGYDGWDLLDYVRTGICTVSVPTADIVKNACAFLLNRCYGGERPVTYTFPTFLIIREAASATR